MKKFLSLVLALVLCLSVASIAMPASADEAPYELVWLRYGSVGTTDAQAGLGAVQDAANEWLKANGYNFTVNMMQVEDANNLQVQMAAKEHIDILWRNASQLTDTLIRGNFLYNIVDLYKNYEGLYNSIPENIWATLLRDGGKALYVIPTYKECGIGVSVSVPVSACKKFGWDELLNDDHTKIWSLDEFTPYLEQAAEDGSYEVLYNFDNNEVVNGSREYYMLDKIAAINNFIGIDLSVEGATEATLVPDIPSYQEYVALMNSWNEAGYIHENFATGQATSELDRLFVAEALTPDQQNYVNSRKELNKDGQGVVYVRMTDTYLNSTSSLGSGMSFASYTPDIDACLKFMDALYGNTEFADLCLYGIEGVNYTRTDDGRVEKIADSGYDFGTWSCANVMTVSLTTTDSLDKKEKYAKFNEEAKPSYILGFVFDTEPVAAEVIACNAVVAEHQKLLENGFMGEDGLAAYREALVSAGAEKVLEEVNRQLAEFFAAK